MRRIDTRISFAVSAALIWAFSDDIALSQDSSHKRGHKADKAQVSEPKSQPPKRKRKQKRTQKPPAAKSTEPMLADKPRTPQPAAAAQPSHVAHAVADDDADVRTEGDKTVKALEFTGLDIEGQLKTPQMLFFLNRLRAEFDRPRLPHRSFMPELKASREDKEL